jgi:phosphohistidine phosphatase SixA
MPNDCRVLPSIVRASRGGTRLGLIAVMLKHKTPKKPLTLTSETLRTLQTQELRRVAGGYTNESLANDKSCKICETDICEF